VVVATGALGLVPWHAAYEPTAAGRHYALDDIVFSYAVSARDFCRTATAPDRPIRSSLVIGDPTGGLAFAGIEARAVHRGFYPDGTYLDGDATPDAVLAWIAAADGPCRLHFACHATSNPSAPAEAHLVLAGGQPLTARRILDATRLAALDIDQALLAACSTHGIGTDHDETFSLATAFLAAGARTVVGSLWPVPDRDTSTLMYLIHLYLHEGDRPADALHRAQRWMLDPHRAAPAGLPADDRRGTDPARPVAWAGFMHLGR
jgi:CHAT domain-containing protein